MLIIAGILAAAWLAFWTLIALQQPLRPTPFRDADIGYKFGQFAQSAIIIAILLALTLNVAAA